MAFACCLQYSISYLFDMDEILLYFNSFDKFCSTQKESTVDWSNLANERSFERIR